VTEKSEEAEGNLLGTRKRQGATIESPECLIRKPATFQPIFLSQSNEMAALPQLHTTEPDVLDSFICNQQWLYNFVGEMLHCKLGPDLRQCQAPA